MQNPKFHGKKQNINEVKGFGRPSAFDPFTHFHDQLYSGYEKNIKNMSMAKQKRSLLRLTWLKFLRAGGRFFFC